MRALLRRLVSPAYWFILNRVRGHSVESYSVALRVKMGKRVVIRAGSEVGPDVSIGDYSYISGPRAYVEAATIGKFCSIARQTTIGVSGHDYRRITTHPFIIDPFYRFVDRDIGEDQKAAPIIGNDVWIGMNAVIHRGVSIGHGAVVGSDAVVTKDVEPYSIVAGNPARHIKYRFAPEVIETLLRIQWWDWSEDKILNAVSDFRDCDLFLSRYGADISVPVDSGV